MPPNPELIDKQQNKNLLVNIGNNRGGNKLGTNNPILLINQQKNPINKERNFVTNNDDQLAINNSVRNNSKNQINNQNQNNSSVNITNPPNNISYNGGGYNSYNAYGGYNPGMMGMGMMSPYMMGGHGMMGGTGPMSFIYSINYSIAMIGQVITMLGMSTQAIMHLYHMAVDTFMKVEKMIRQSAIRRWFQQKSKKSPLLRWIFILSTMAVVNQVVKLLKYLIEYQLNKNKVITSNPTSSIIDTITNTITTSNTSI